MTSDATTNRAVLDLAQDHIHLSLDASATPLPDFSWSEDGKDAYRERFTADDGKGRIVCAFEQGASWDAWERHPAGDEVVIAMSGRFVVVQDLGEEHRRIELGPGQAMINPAGVWHTADVIEAGVGLFITPGEGTEHRPR